MAKHASDASSVELSHYATVVRRRWRFVVAGILLGVVLSTALVLFLPTRATATTQVNVNLISSNAFNSQRPASDLIDMQTEQSMARSTSVTSAVAEELGDGWTKASVRAATEATLLPDGTVLRVEFTAGDAVTAANGAALVAEKYLQYRSDQAQGRVDVASERLTVRRNTLNKQLAQANVKVAEAPEVGASRIAAEMERQGIADELSSVTSQLNELRAVDTSGGTVLMEADPQQVASSPNRPLILASGLFGGALLGLVLAFVANVLDRRVRDSYDVFGAGGGITVARLEGEVATVPAAGDDADALRAVRERLLSTAAGNRTVFSVVDVGDRAARPSDVAANLAVALADSGMTTDLVLADLPDDALRTVLAALEVHEVEPAGAVRRFRGGFDLSLTVLVPAPGHQRLSTADIVSDLLSDGVRSADVTVVAVAQAAGPAVRLSAGRACDQVLLVAEEMATRIDDLAQAVTDLLAVQAVIHGTVLVPRGRQLGGVRASDPVPAAPVSAPVIAPVPAPVIAPVTDSEDTAGETLEETDAPPQEVVDTEEGSEEGTPDEAPDGEIESSESLEQAEPTPEPTQEPAEEPIEEPAEEPAASSNRAAKRPRKRQRGTSGAKAAGPVSPHDVIDTSVPPDEPVVANENSWAFTR